MSIMSVTAGRIELSDPSMSAGAQPYSGMHALSPILIGFSAPLVLLVLLAPSSFANVKAIAAGVLAVAMLAATVIFLHAVFSAGRIAAVAFDPEARIVEITSIGSFARRVETIPFADVAGLTSAVRYDRDGYKSVTTQLVLRSGDAIEVPLEPSQVELNRVRALLARH